MHYLCRQQMQQAIEVPCRACAIWRLQGCRRSQACQRSRLQHLCPVHAQGVLEFFMTCVCEHGKLMP